MPGDDRVAGLPSLAIPWTAFADLAAVRDYSRYGDHFLAIRPVAPDTLSSGVFAEEWHDGVIVDVPETVPGVHVVVAGTPHRAKHVQGYWHIDPRDEIVITVPPGSSGDHAWRVVVETVRRRGEVDRVAWFCRGCHGLLTDVAVAEAVDDIPAFELQVEDVVRAFNADAAGRTCGRCGAVHPPAYSPLTPLSDESKEARKVW